MRRSMSTSLRRSLSFIVLPIHLRRQGARALLARGGDQASHQALAEAVLAALGRDAERVDHRDRVLLAEFAAQDAGNSKTAQHIVRDDADMDEVGRPRLGGRKAFLEEMPPAVAGA